MRQAGQIEAFGYHKYYRANPCDSQELSVISFIFVTYVKTLCKQHYVNYVYCGTKQAHRGHMWCDIANPAPYIENQAYLPVSSTFRVVFRKNICEEKNFVIFTTLTTTRTG